MVAKAAEFAEGRRFHKNERTCEQPLEAAQAIPEPGEDIGSENSLIEPHGGTAREAFAGNDRVGHLVQQFGAGVRVGIHKNEPVAGGRGSTGVPCTADLVEGFKDDGGPGGAGDLGRAVGGIVVADDEFEIPAPACEGGRARFDFDEGGSEQLLFVEGGHDDGDLHPVSVRGVPGFSTGAMILVVLFLEDDF